MLLCPKKLIIMLPVVTIVFPIIISKLTVAQIKAIEGDLGICSMMYCVTWGDKAKKADLAEIMQDQSSASDCSEAELESYASTILNHSYNLYASI